MATSEIKARVQHKRDTSANWTANDPVLFDGEVIIVITASGEKRTKSGDGVSRYSQLPFDDEVIKASINDRVAKAQGAENAGKVLAVGADGNVTLVTSVATGGAKTWGDLIGLDN